MNKMNVHFKVVAILNGLFMVASFLALGLELDWLFENLIWISVLLWSLILLARFMSAHDGSKTYKASFLLVFLSAYVVRTAGLLMAYDFMLYDEVFMVIFSVFLSCLIASVLDCILLGVITYEEIYMGERRTAATAFNIFIMFSGVIAAVGGVNWFADICA